ncbi:hypothetical protein Kpho02_07080 [Kitasatospora phosalacinea]|uniref:Uncharacterized protein n=1 Tax=Kitasatospora phosalacinea TaxID=2065 RepID=A0A9W6Q4G5_9ACTN|nr:hypothetical protein [Kitasatospora phosalacinea]GLW68409.1 hypothetical protein Kpho02_07080 [Kitasatospora phosalacinea]
MERTRTRTRTRARRTGTGPALLTAALLAAGLLLAGCSSAGHPAAAPPPSATGSSAGSSAAGPSAPGSGASAAYHAPTAAPGSTDLPPDQLTDAYFAEGSCARALPATLGSDAPRYEMTPCDSPQAEARVTKRSGTLTGVAAALPQGADCPDGTDVALDLTQNTLVPDITKGRSAWACLRNLHDPHPGDPGGGGGPGIVVGDCVYATKDASGREGTAETRCDGGGEHAPEYKVDKVYVSKAVTGTKEKQPSCPDGATVSFTLPPAPGTLAMNAVVACAEPVG